MSRRKETRLPALTTIESIKEALDVRLGRRGDPMDRALTMRDIIDSGIPIKAVRRSGFNEFYPEYQERPQKLVPKAPEGLVAMPIFGGIHILWDSPGFNASRLVAEISRSESADVESRVVLTYAGGNSFLDMIDSGDSTEYFYWVRFLSDSEHYGPYAGPVSAVTMPLVGEVIERISGEIDESVLAESLRTEIGRIGDLDGQLTTTIERLGPIESDIERIEPLEGLLYSDASVVGSVDNRIQGARQEAESNARTYTNAEITKESTARQDQFSSITQMIDELEAGLDGDYSAGLLLERQARVEQGEALSSDLAVVQAQAQENLGMITSLTESTANDLEAQAMRSDLLAALFTTQDAATTAMIRVEETARATEDSAIVGRLVTLQGEVDANWGAFTDEQQIQVTKNEALAKDISDLAAKTETDIDSVASAIRQENVAESSRLDGRIDTTASSVSTLESTLRGELEETATGLQGDIDSLDIVASGIRSDLTTNVERIDGGISTNATTIDTVQSALKDYKQANDGRLTLAEEATSTVEGELDTQVMRIDGELRTAGERIDTVQSSIRSLPLIASHFDSSDAADDWSVAPSAGFTLVGESYSGSGAALITSSDSSPTSSGLTGGARLRIEDSAALAFGGRRVRVTLYAKRPAEKAAEEFAVAYSTAQVGNSGWQRFTPTDTWQRFTFLYDVAIPQRGNYDALGIWGDTSGSGLGVLVDSVVVESVPSLEDLPDVGEAISTVREDASTMVSDFGDSLIAEGGLITEVRSELAAEQERLDGRVDGAIQATSAVRDDMESHVSRIDGEIASSAKQINTVQASLLAAQGAGSSLLRNGMFATGDFWGWDVIDGVELIAKGADTGAVNTYAPAQYFVEFLDANHDSVVDLASEKRPVSPGDEFNVQFYWTSRSRSSGALHLNVQWFDGDGLYHSFARIAEVEVDASGSATWDRTPPKAVTVPEGAALGRVVVARQPGGTGRATIAGISAPRIDSSLADGIATVRTEMEAEVSRVEGLVSSEAGRIDLVQASLDGEIGDRKEAITGVEGLIQTKVEELEGGISLASGKVDTVETRLRGEFTSKDDALDGRVDGVNLAVSGVRSDLDSEITRIDGAIASTASLQNTVRSALEGSLPGQEQGATLNRNGSFATGDTWDWPTTYAIALEQRDPNGSAIHATAPSAYFAVFDDTHHDLTRNTVGEQLPVSEGDEFTCRISWAVSAGATGRVRFGIQWFSSDGSYRGGPPVSDIDAVDLVADSWQRSPEVTVQAPVGAAFGRALVTRYEGSSGLFYFTGVETTRVSDHLTKGLATVQQNLDTAVDNIEGEISAVATSIDDVQAEVADDFAAVRTESRATISSNIIVRNGNFSAGLGEGWGQIGNLELKEKLADTGGLDGTAPSRFFAEVAGDGTSKNTTSAWVEVAANERYSFKLDWGCRTGATGRFRAWVQERDATGGTYRSPQVVNVPDVASVSAGEWQSMGPTTHQMGPDTVEARLVVSFYGTGNVAFTNVVFHRADVALGALYTARVQANGLVGGFGLYNDGAVVDAGFDVDRFWVGRTDNDKRKPFIIQGGSTYIDEAMIRDASIQEAKIGPLTIGKLQKADGTPVTTAAGLLRADAIDTNSLYVAGASKFTGNVTSTNYSPGKSGWRILQNGTVEFNEGTFNGQVEFKDIPYSAITGSDRPNPVQRHKYTVGSDAGDRWWTIAFNPGSRASATFRVWDTASGRHNSVEFKLSASYNRGDLASFVLTSAGRYGTHVFQAVRLYTKGTYDTMYVKVLVRNLASNIDLNCEIADNIQTTGWTSYGPGWNVGTSGYSYKHWDISPELVGAPAQWVRPNTTLINGNKIYTGDAYVDTLQIKGQAVTVPVSAENLTRTSVISKPPKVWYDWGVYANPGNLLGGKALVSARASLEWRVVLGSRTNLTLNLWMRVLDSHGRVVHQERMTRAASGTGSWPHYFRTGTSGVFEMTGEFHTSAAITRSANFRLQWRYDFALSNSNGYSIYITKAGGYMAVFGGKR